MPPGTYIPTESARLRTHYWIAPPPWPSAAPVRLNPGWGGSGGLEEPRVCFAHKAVQLHNVDR